VAEATLKDFLDRVGEALMEASADSRNISVADE